MILGWGYILEVTGWDWFPRMLRPFPECFFWTLVFYLICIARRFSILTMAAISLFFVVLLARILSLLAQAWRIEHLAWITSGIWDLPLGSGARWILWSVDRRSNFRFFVFSLSHTTLFSPLSANSHHLDCYILFLGPSRHDAIPPVFVFNVLWFFFCPHYFHILNGYSCFARYLIASISCSHYDLVIMFHFHYISS